MVNYPEGAARGRHGLAPNSSSAPAVPGPSARPVYVRVSSSDSRAAPPGTSRAEYCHVADNTPYRRGRGTAKISPKGAVGLVRGA